MHWAFAASPYPDLLDAQFRRTFQNAVEPCTVELFIEALACLELHPIWGGPGAPRNFGLSTVLVGIYTPGFKYILDLPPFTH